MDVIQRSALYQLELARSGLEGASQDSMKELKAALSEERKIKLNIQQAIDAGVENGIS